MFLRCLSSIIPPSYLGACILAYLNHCYHSPCVCAISICLFVQVNLLLASEALNNRTVSTLCMFAFFSPCVENFTFHRSQLRRHAPPAGIRTTWRVRGTIPSQIWPACCLGVTREKKNNNLRVGVQPGQWDLLLLLLQLFFFFKNQCL